MQRHIDELGNVYRADVTGNLYKNDKLINPFDDQEISVLDNAVAFFESRTDLVPLSLVTGHVSKFTFGYGDNKVTVNTQTTQL